MLKNLFTRCTSAGNLLTQRHLEWIFRMTTTRPLLVMTGFLLAMVLSLASISTVRFDTNIFNLFPSKQPALKLMLESLEWSGSAGEAYFLLQGPPERLPAEAGSFARRLEQARVDGQPAFRRITWQIYDEKQAGAFSDLVSYAVAHPQLFLAEGDVQKYINRFDASNVDASLQRLQSTLAGQFGGAMTNLAMADPLSLRDLILPRLKIGSQALNLDPASPYFISRDKTLLIMIAEPVKPVQDMVFARKLVAAINEARRGAPIAITCAGAHISAVLDEQLMKKNILISIVSSLVVVLGIFYGAYRRFLPTLLIPVILVCGVVLSLGLFGLFTPSIHIISFAFTALITGIGTDYSIHLYDRFHTERASGKGCDEALRLTLLNTGHGIFTAAVTTAVPFLALSISDVRALSEMGILVGLGVIFSLYATLFFLPPLLMFMERRYPITYRPIPGFGLHGVWRLATRRPGLVTVLTIGLVCFMFIVSFRIGFDGELRNLQPRHSEAFIAQEQIEQHLSLAPKHVLVALDGPELGPVLARASRVESLAATLQEQGEITTWSSLGKIINSPETQARIVQQLQTGFPGDGLDGVVREKLDQQGFSSDEFRQFLDSAHNLGKAAVVPEDEAIRILAASPLRGIVDRHLAKDAHGYHALIYLHYRGAEFKQDAFLKALGAIDPNARTTGVDLVSSQLSSAVKDSFAGAFLIGGILVIMLLMVHFIDAPSGLFYSLFPVVAGSVCMLGTMALTGMRLNFMNVMVLVTILGMGSDFGLYIRFRVDAATHEGREIQYCQIGRSVFLSAMTTIVGFGSLAFTDYGAMSSIGWATNLGVGYTTLFAMVTLPAVIALFRRRENRA
ncbi:MAG: MMPL family transporter [Desulfuromonadales bacterium]|nr:MMPL family transporter [Desulfuromonadales bacterium]